MLKVLAKEPSARYRTADQLGRVLLTFAAPTELAAAEAYTPGPMKLDAKTGRLTRLKQIFTLPDGEGMQTDWLAVGLGLVAVLMVGGLLPFWMWVYFVFNPPFQ
jgi:serine/threonine-protein kinase